MQNRNVLISGGSIAGPALAYWLRRYGFNPTVLERAPAPRPGGQAIDLRGAARDVVERMGLMAEVRRAHTGVLGMTYVDSAGRRMASMSADLLGDSGGIIAELEILRGDLVRLLYDATATGVEYLFDDSVTELVEGTDGVKVSFERSAPRSFDLVVGADGLHSNVRRLAFGPESRYINDLGYYKSIFSATTSLDLAGWEQFYSMPAGARDNGKMAALYPLRQPGQARGMFFFAAPPHPYDRHDLAAQRRLLTEVYAGQGWQVPELLESMRQAPDLYLDRECRVDLDRWSTGRTVLLGDAVFAGSVGMGTSMALVGAYVLAGELAAANGEHGVAFAHYETGLRDYVARCRKPMPGGAKGFLPATRRGIWMRNQSIRLMTHLPGKSMLTGGLEKTANAVSLKDYSTWYV